MPPYEFPSETTNDGDWTTMIDENYPAPPSPLSLAEATTTASVKHSSSILKRTASPKAKQKNKHVHFAQDSSEPCDASFSSSSSVSSSSTYSTVSASSFSSSTSASSSSDHHDHTTRAAAVSSLDKIGTGDWYNRQGNAYYRQRNWERAIRAYQHAANRCAMGPHTADALANLGAVYWSTGEWNHAMHVLHQALAMYPRVYPPSEERQILVANVYHQLGLVHYLQGHLASALSALQVALWMREQSGTNAVVAKTMEALGQVCFLARNYSAAVAWYTQALGKQRSTSILERLALAYHQAGDSYSTLNVYHDLLQEYRARYEREATTPSKDNPSARREWALKRASVLAKMMTILKRLRLDSDASERQRELMELAKQEGIVPAELGLEQFS